MSRTQIIECIAASLQCKSESETPFEGTLIRIDTHTVNELIEIKKLYEILKPYKQYSKFMKHPS